MEKVLSRAFLLLIDPAVVCILAALVVAVGTSMCSRGATRSREPRVGSIPAALRVASLAVVASWLVGYGAQRRIEFPAVVWWRFGLVLLVAAVGVPTVLVHGSRRVLPEIRKASSYPGGHGIRSSRASGGHCRLFDVRLVAVTVWAGSMSTPDANGMYTLLIFGTAG